MEKLLNIGHMYIRNLKMISAISFSLSIGCETSRFFGYRKGVTQDNEYLFDLAKVFCNYDSRRMKSFR